MTDFHNDINNIKFFKLYEQVEIREPVKEISEKIGFNKGQVLKILSNKLSVSTNFLNKFAEVYNLTESHGQPIPKVALNPENMGVPVYDVGFTAGFVDFFKGLPVKLGHINLPEVMGADMIVRANDNSMKGIIDNGDWVAIKKIRDSTVISYGSLYGIVTTDLQLLKFIHKSTEKDNWLLKSTDSSKYPDFDILINKVVELYIIKTVLNIKMLN